MTDYKTRIEQRRKRYAERAVKKRAEADVHYAASRSIADRIPLGQPVLVGHHSEKRHRRDLDRIDRSMRKSFEAGKAAADYEHRAVAHGTHGVSADDPDAVSALREKLAELEARRDEYKAHNRRARAAGDDILPAYMLKNLGANIRRYRKRIDDLTAAAEREESLDVVGEGFRIEECKLDNRVRFYFDARPDRDTCRAMKAAGFRWSPTASAWQRQLNNAGIYAAKRMARELFGWEG